MASATAIRVWKNGIICRKAIEPPTPRTKLAAAMARGANGGGTKSAAELALIRKAAEITVAAQREAMRAIEPGMNEFEVQALIEYTFRRRGADRPSFSTIVGSGPNSTTLHYNRDDRLIQDGDLIVMDIGASAQGYAADVTRTVPVNGRFTPEQREAYELVLRAQAAAIKAARPGAKLSDVDAAARAVIDKAGHGDAFIHGTGHPLGIEVHDVSPDGPLRAGMIMTVEPGVYFPDRKMGVRIEDDILITPSGPKNLTAMIPKTVAEVEAAMKSR